MVSTVANGSYDHYYRRIKKLMLRMGLWPYQDRRERFIRTLVLNILLLMIFVIQVHQLSLPSFKIESSYQEVQLFLLSLCSIFCYYNIVFNMDLTKKLRERLITDWEQVSCEEEYNIMKKYAEESEQFNKFITLVIYLFGISLITPSLCTVFLHVFHIKNDTKLSLPVPLKSITFFEEHFYVALSTEFVAIWTLLTIGIVSYTSFLMCIKHSCALLRVITFKIYQPFKLIPEDVPFDWSSRTGGDAYEWIKEIARRYKNATEYIDLINALSEKVYLVEMFTATLVVVMNSLLLFQSFEMLQSKSLEYIYQVVMSGIHMIGSIVIIYMNCYIGQTLIDHGTLVLESFNQVSFYELPLKCQRVLPMMMLRSSKSCAILIGGMFVASNDFFARFMNASLSYMTVCCNLR